MECASLKARCQPTSLGLIVNLAASHGDPWPGLSAFETLVDDSTWRCGKGWRWALANDPMVSADFSSSRIGTTPGQLGHLQLDRNSSGTIVELQRASHIAAKNRPNIARSRNMLMTNCCSGSFNVVACKSKIPLVRYLGTGPPPSGFSGLTGDYLPCAAQLQASVPTADDSRTHWCQLEAFVLIVGIGE